MQNAIDEVPKVAAAERAAIKGRRRTLWVDGRLQGILLRRDLAFGLILIATFVSTLLLPLLLALHETGDAQAELEVALAFLHLHGTLWPAGALSLLVVVCASIFTSHRLAGPLARLRRHLRLAQMGERPGPFIIRAGDHLQADIDQLNATMAALEARAEAFDRLQAALLAAQAASGPGDPQRALCEQLLKVRPAES